MPCKNCWCLSMSWRPDCLLLIVRTKVLHHRVPIIILCKTFIRPQVLQEFDRVLNEISLSRVEFKVCNIIISEFCCFILRLVQVVLFMGPLTCNLSHCFFIAETCCHWRSFGFLTHNGHIIGWTDLHDDYLFFQFVGAILMPFSSNWQFRKSRRIHRFYQIVYKRSRKWYYLGWYNRMKHCV